MKGGKEIMKTNKAQSEIITTVLIILLVLAAIVIVWQVVQGTINKGGKAVTAGAECIGLNLEINRANATTDTVTVTRKAGGTTEDVTVVILKNGVVQTPEITGLAQLESETSAAITDGLAVGDKITLGAKIGTDITCDSGATPYTVTAV